MEIKNDKNETLGIVSDKYRILQNEEAFEVIRMLSSKRMSYQPARTIMFAALGWLFPAIARFMGIMETKAKFARMILAFDLTAVVVFVLAVIYLVYAMVHNTKRISHFG